MYEDDNSKERRLAREAKTGFLGSLGDRDSATDTARVEVSYMVDDDAPEHAGYLLVHVNCTGSDEHPANLASDKVYAWGEPKFKGYFSVDDVYAA